MTVYILIVGIVYNLILRFIWSPQGLQRVVDELLHLITPVLFLCFWLVFVPKNKVKIMDILPWLIYPLAYIVLILIRGSFSGFYPYPFIDVHVLGLKKVLLNSIGLTVAFIIMSLLLVFIGNLMNKKIENFKAR